MIQCLSTMTLVKVIVSFVRRFCWNIQYKPLFMVFLSCIHGLLKWELLPCVFVQCLAQKNTQRIFGGSLLDFGACKIVNSNWQAWRQVTLSKVITEKITKLTKDCSISLYANTVLAGTWPAWRIQITFRTQVGCKGWVKYLREKFIKRVIHLWE